MLSAQAYARQQILVDIISVVAYGQNSCFDTWCVKFKTLLRKLEIIACEKHFIQNILNLHIHIPNLHIIIANLWSDL